MKIYDISQEVFGCQVYPGERTEAVLEMWSRVKGDNLGLGIVVVIFVSVGVMLVYTVYRRIQRYQHEKLQRRRRRHRKRR